MPTVPNPSFFPPFIYGLHDIGGQDRLLSAQRPGWVLDTVDLRSQTGTDYSSLARAGLGILVRLNHGYAPAGTIPPSTHYAEFAARCAAYVSQSPGAHIWLIGNEMNLSAERPELPDGTHEVITPEKYAQCFRLCRTAIKNLAGHSDDLIIPGAIGPYNAETGDWVQYLVDLLNLLDEEVDGIALHCYTHEFDAGQIASDDMMNPPYAQRHFNFRAYRDFLVALPKSFRTLPVFITETNPYAGWRDANIAWIQSAYAEINAWNADPTRQPIQALVLFRWRTLPDHPEWGIQDKPALIADFLAALTAGYRVRLPAPAPRPVPAPTRLAARFLTHDTPVSIVTGQTTTVNLRLENTGATKWTHGGAHPVHIGYRWLNAKGEQQLDVEDRRTALPADVAPGREIALGAILAAPKTPGAYTLRWDLVAEGMTWFAEAGNPPLDVQISVTAAPKDISGWRAESNVNPARVARALDGDPTTFWDSETPQAAGQWFRLNLSTPRWIDGLQFLSPGKGFPAAYALRVSGDGRHWNEVARLAADNTYDVMAVFAPQPIQYAQIDLLDAATGQSSWRISEILIHAATPWTASASHNASAAPQAIDNRPDTAWTSGAPQSPGMFFQIDLGRVEQVAGLMLVAPTGEHPAGFRIALWNANANRWQIAYEKSNNTAPVDVIFAATPTQFINIQLIEASDKPWAILHARVIREMENWLGPTL